MIKKIKTLLRRLVYGHRADSECYIRYLRRQGVRVGKNVKIYSPETVILDDSCGCLLNIGDDVTITKGVTVLTHDYAWSVLRKTSPDKGRILGAQSPVTIGNNVFIGVGAILTRGITVGDNVVIGAGSVVTGDCEGNAVYAGNPARKLMTLDDYRRKREEKQLEEAVSLARCYRDRYQADPPKELFREYFLLFAGAEEAENTPAFRKQLQVGDNYGQTLRWMREHPPVFQGYEAFLDHCFDRVTP